MSANAEIIAELRRVLNERDEARAALASCPDCAMYAERSARWHDDMQRAERERDEARASAAEAYKRGAEAMREACAEACWSVPPDAHPSDCAFAVNALPIPEEP